MSKISIVVVVVMALFGAFVGYSPNPTANTLTAAPPIVLPQLEKPTSLLDIKVNLETGQLDVNSIENRDVNVTIENKVPETTPVYITKTVEVEKVVVIDDYAKTTRLLNRFMPLPNPNKWQPATELIGSH